MHIPMVNGKSLCFVDVSNSSQSVFSILALSNPRIVRVEGPIPCFFPHARVITSESFSLSRKCPWRQKKALEKGRKDVNGPRALSPYILTLFPCCCYFPLFPAFSKDADSARSQSNIIHILPGNHMRRISLSRSYRVSRWQCGTRVWILELPDSNVRE